MKHNMLLHMGAYGAMSAIWYGPPQYIPTQGRGGTIPYIHIYIYIYSFIYLYGNGGTPRYIDM